MGHLRHKRGQVTCAKVMQLVNDRDPKPGCLAPRIAYLLVHHIAFWRENAFRVYTRAPMVCLRVPVSPRPPCPLCPRAVCLHFSPPLHLLKQGDRVPTSSPSPAQVLAPRVLVHQSLSHFPSALLLCPSLLPCVLACMLRRILFFVTPRTGSSVHGILQARTLEWVAISSSRGSSWIRNQNPVSCFSCTSRRILH